jgi:hypothetical protein
MAIEKKPAMPEGEIPEEMPDEVTEYGEAEVAAAPPAPAAEEEVPVNEEPVGETEAGAEATVDVATFPMLEGLAEGDEITLSVKSVNEDGTYTLSAV